jgi:hypothetical protein
MHNEHIEPIMFDEVVYEDNSIFIKKICLWENCRIVEDDETKLLIVLLPGSEMFSLGHIGTYALPDGTRATKEDFYYIGKFHEGLSKIAVKDKGLDFTPIGAHS